MSFASEIKNEVTRLDSSRLEEIAELSAIVRNTSVVTDSISINIENNAVARRIYKMFKNIYDIIPTITVRKRYNFNKGFSYILVINRKVSDILLDLSYRDVDGKLFNIPKSYIISDDEALRAYLRGVFISTGSVNDPKTSRYHLEFLLDNMEYAKFINKILNDYGLNSRIIRKDKYYMVYIKEAEKVSDFLRVIKAYNAVMYFEDIRIYRDHKNMTNRLNNCEQANVDKIFMTSSKQIRDIEAIKESGLYGFLDDKLKIVIDYRLKYTESSLQELCDIISLETGNNLTKSGLNHRFRKIKEIAQNINDKS